MKTMHIINLSYLFLVLSLLSCSVKKVNEIKNSSNVVIHRVQRVNNLMFVHGEIINETKSEMFIPDLGEQNIRGITETSYGSVEQIINGDWKTVSPFNDGIMPLIAIRAGDRVKFVFNTGVPYPRERAVIRIKFNNSVFSSSFEAIP